MLTPDRRRKIVTIARRAAVAVAILLVVIQFVRPSRANPPTNDALTIQRHLDVPPPVEAVFERSCNDCHSNQTAWPWYSQIAPVSWVLADHVKDGRGELNFSEWGSYSPKKSKRKLEEICREVKDGDMPVWNYELIHPSSKLSAEEKKIICDWAASVAR